MSTKTLFIVESPGKRSKISSILGPNYNVQASIGHLRDLPKKSLGVDTDTWKASYEVSNEKAIANLKKHLKSCQKVILATDDDREGEAIAWHIAKVLNLDVKTTERVTFSEITKSALTKALAGVHRIDMKKVAAQEARRILDRILGYKLTKPLNLYLAHYGGLSAGRVQSVAVKIVAERELAIQNFVAVDHFKLFGNFSVDGVQFKAEWDYKKHFNNEAPPKTINGGEFDYWTHRSELEKYAAEINRNPDCKVISVEKKSTSRKPPPPFITSSFQMACSNKYKIAPKKAMQIAQKLYESGHITYMRTDNPNISDETIGMVNTYIQKWCSSKELDASRYMLDEPNKWKAKGDAQEAHEGIRPTSFDNDGSDLSDPELQKVYKMIFDRTVACQMASALYDNTTVNIETKSTSNSRNIVLTTKGNVLKFSGWKALMDSDFSEDDNNEKDSESMLPDLAENDDCECKEAGVDVKKTKPPGRFTEASLVKALESNGVGRPSTYASIMTTIQDRGYVEVVDKKSHKLGATQRGIDVYKVLNDAFTFMDVKYTQRTEEHLDGISKGQIGFKNFMVQFYSDFLEESSNFVKVANKNSTAPDCPVCNINKLMKIKNKKRPGYSWLCGGYRSGVCKTVYPDKNGSPNFDYKPPTVTEHKCPSCNGELTRFMFETNFSFRCMPCKVSIKGTESAPDFEMYHSLQEQKKTAESCPTCKTGKLLKKKSNFGEFFSCDAFPKCKTTLKVSNAGKPDFEEFKERAEKERLKKEEIKNAPPESKCKKCKKGIMVEKNNGAFLGCSNYPRCKNTQNIEKQSA